MTEVIGTQAWRDLKGKWNDEPDFVESKSKGFHTVVFRDSEMGHLCGYIGVNIFHPAYGLHYDDKMVSSTSVHGGLTFSGERMFPTKLKNKFWYFGFDTAHYMDVVPSMLVLRRSIPEFSTLEIYKSMDTYKDFSYVTDEVYSLLEQMKLIAETGVKVNHKKVYRKLHKAKNENIHWGA